MILQCYFHHMNSRLCPQGRLTGAGGEDLPTIVLVAHYDSFGVAPVRTSCHFLFLCELLSWYWARVFLSVAVVWRGLERQRGRHTAGARATVFQTLLLQEDTCRVTLVFCVVKQMLETDFCLLDKKLLLFLFIDTTCCFSCREVGSLTTKALNAGWRTIWITQVGKWPHVTTYTEWAFHSHLTLRIDVNCLLTCLMFKS